MTPVIPAKIRVGHLVFDTLLVDKCSADAASAVGWTKKSTQQIRVEEGLSAALTLDTLYHEIMHAMYFVYGWNKDEMTEEQVAGALAGALVRLWQDNPDLTKLTASPTL